MYKKVILFTLPTLAILITAIMVTSSFENQKTINPDGSQGNIQYRGYVCVCEGDSCPVGGEYDGNRQCSHNLITNAGLNHIRDVLGQGYGSTAFNFIALNNASGPSNSPQAGDTALENEYTLNGLSRASGGYATLGTGNWSIYKTFTSSGMSGLITNKTGLFNQSSGGTMLAENTFNLVTLDGTASDTLTVNWTIFVVSS